MICVFCRNLNAKKKINNPLVEILYFSWFFFLFLLIYCVLYVCLDVWSTCMNFVENVNFAEAAFWLGMPQSAYNILWAQPNYVLYIHGFFLSCSLQSTERFNAKSNGHFFFDEFMINVLLTTTTFWLVGY